MEVQRGKWRQNNKLWEQPTRWNSPTNYDSASVTVGGDYKGLFRWFIEVPEGSIIKDATISYYVNSATSDEVISYGTLRRNIE